MNIKLRYSTTFVAGVWLEGQLEMGNYSVDINLLTQTLDPQDIEIALDRIKYFLNNTMHSTTFISQADTEYAEALDSLNIDITTLPAEPVDLVVGIALYYKLNAIMEGRAKVSEIVLCSDLGDNIEYFYNEHDKHELFELQGWWSSPGLAHSDLVFDDDQEVEKPSANNEWKDLDLSWAQSEPTLDIDKVIFSNFSQFHNETKH